MSLNSTQNLEPSVNLAGYLQQRDFFGLRRALKELAPLEVAGLIEELEVEEQAVVFRLLPRAEAAEVFEKLPHDAQEQLLRALAQKQVAELLNDMAPDDRTELLDELPASVTKHLLALLTPEERAVAVSLLGYPEASVGRLMTPDYVRVRAGWTVAHALDHIRKHGRDSETLNAIYVVDERGVLIDDIRIREVLLAAPETLISELMKHRGVALNAHDDQEEAVAVFRREDRTALPVTDSAGVLIGIVTVDDVLHVADEEATEDIHKIGGLAALEEPYMQVSLLRMLKKRAGWLVVLFLGEMLTASAMGFFQHEIERAVVLALFVPLIISAGGNTGSQAATLVIRALALGEVGLADWWRVMRREIVTGLLLGVVLGVIGFARIELWSLFTDIYGPHSLLVAFTVGLSLVGIVLWGTLSGSMLPFILRRLGFDPATSSAPFVATLVDVTGLIIYFSIAAMILRGTLL